MSAKDDPASSSSDDRQPSCASAVLCTHVIKEEDEQSSFSPCKFEGIESPPCKLEGMDSSAEEATDT